MLGLQFKDSIPGLIHYEVDDRYIGMYNNSI